MPNRFNSDFNCVLLCPWSKMVGIPKSRAACACDFSTSMMMHSCFCSERFGVPKYFNNCSKYSGFGFKYFAFFRWIFSQLILVQILFSQGMLPNKSWYVCSFQCLLSKVPCLCSICLFLCAWRSTDFHQFSILFAKSIRVRDAF